MQIIDCEQGSDEWWAARCGIPTASEFSKILTPATLATSSSATAYMHKLVAEKLRGKPDESFQSEWMKRGNELEPEAADYYGLLKDCKPQQVGFCLDERGFGCSPDRFVNDDGGLEIKCPSPSVQVGYLLGNKLPTIYRPQTLGNLLVTGRQWWDFISYHPDLDPLIIRTYRKDVLKDIAVLLGALTSFTKRLNASLNKLNLKEAA